VSRERCHQREAERSGIDADFGDARNQIHAEATIAPSAQWASSSPAAPPSAAAAGFPRPADARRARDLSSSSRKPREQQVGDIRARDQQHARHRAKEQQVTLPLRADRIVQ
jgi:hypothetical protein